MLSSILKSSRSIHSRIRMNKLITFFQSAFTSRSSFVQHPQPSLNNFRPNNPFEQSVKPPLPEQTISIPEISSQNPCLTCQSPCSTHLSYPSELKIDHELPLKNTVQPYVRHVVICTGKKDWEKVIELEKGSLSSELFNLNAVDSPVIKKEPPLKTISTQKKAKKEKILITNSSCPSSFSLFNRGNDVLLFPDNLLISKVSTQKAKEFYNLFLSSEKRETQDESEGEEKFETMLIPYKSVILICGHKRRDIRCGVAGPMLKDEFDKVLEDMKLDIQSSGNKGVAVYLSSHVGGHHFAGNVIVYRDGQGIWYGRVTPCHVRMIVEKTVMEGKVIKELYRGSMLGSFSKGDEGQAGKLDW
ncbi:2288_t:CDS:2 [Acaulospora morrowiae]|uniref:2288_t:CDS:1 n=1 Tax=Acaulospora morrowiae TaxID=94023 RepID=A0A9N9CRH3_9GLOM|nr:2288_t:CDS:2 [Acaulospora morrowiae]